MRSYLTPQILISGLLACSALAGEPDLSQSIAPPPASSDWEFDLAIYGFLAGIDATISVGGLTANKDFKFGDILSNLDATFMASASATNGRFRLAADFLYLGVSGDDSTPGRIYDLTHMELDSVVSTVSGTWRVWEQENDYLEIGAGVRYLGMDATVDLVNFSGIAPSQRIGMDDGLWDGLFVIRYFHSFSPKWFLQCYGDIGTGDSDLTWQAFANMGYNVNDWCALMLGWRHIDYKQVDSVSRLNLFFSGPQISAGFRF